MHNPKTTKTDIVATFLSQTGPRAAARTRRRGAKPGDKTQVESGSALSARLGQPGASPLSVLKRVKRDPHADPAVTWSVLGTADEGGGAGMHFRGFHRRAAAVAGDVSGDFFASSQYGDFEQYRVQGEDGHLGATGWFGHNPFADGEYWATVEIGGVATAIADNYRVVHTRAEAMAEVTAVAQAFVVLNTGEVIVSTEYVAAVAVEFRPELYVPPGLAREKFLGLIYMEGRRTSDRRSLWTTTPTYGRTKTCG